MQQSLFDEDGSGGGRKVRCECCTHVYEFDVPTLGFGPRYDCQENPECVANGEYSYFIDLNQREVHWAYRAPDEPPYASSEKTLKCEELGYCPAIAQGRIAGIDPHSAEHVVYIRPTDYLKAAGDGEDEYYQGDFLCFAAIRLPYEAGRGSILYELSRGILLVTADRASASAEAGQAGAFFGIVDLLKKHWEGGVGIVLSFVHAPPGAVGDGSVAWPRGQPTWEDGGHMASD